MTTSPGTPPHWNVAPLLIAGVALGLLGMASAEASAGWGALMNLAGLVLLLAGLVRWTRRTRQTRQTTAAAATPGRVTSSA